MPATYITVSLPYNTNLPRDISQFGLAADGAPDAPTSALRTAIETFFNVDVPGGTDALGQFYSSVIVRGENVGTIKVYAINLTTGKIGDPVAESPFDFTVESSANIALPEEVALCSSIRAPSASTPGRGKGRIYLGPWNADTNTISTGVSRPSAQLRDTIRLATARLYADFALNSVALSVWSRTDKALAPVTGGWVDNAWDTQRRRGVDTDVREVWGTL